jgi:hypothetical protein
MPVRCNGTNILLRGAISLVITDNELVIFVQFDKWALSNHKSNKSSLQLKINPYEKLKRN